jgi:hypothetical protein
MPPAATEIAHIPTSSKGEGEIHIASFELQKLKNQCLHYRRAIETTSNYLNTRTLAI